MLVAALGLTAAGCSNDDEPGGNAAATKPGFPVTITSCGTEQTFDAPPERAVTMDQPATEAFLALGLADSMAGTAFLFNPPVFPELADDYERVPVLAEAGFPSKEKLLSASPDFVVGTLDGFTYSGFPPGSNFSREELAERDIASFALRCPDETQTVGLLYKRYREIGRIFGVSDRAAAFVEDVRSGLAATTSKLEGAKPVKTLFVAGPGEQGLVTRGGAFEALSLAGGTNVFEDLPPLVGGAPPNVSFEQVIDRDPEVIVLDDPGTSDPSAPSVEAQRAQLEDRLRTTTAAKDDRFCFTKRADFEGGPRTVEAVRKLARCLHPEVDF